MTPRDRIREALREPLFGVPGTDAEIAADLGVDVRSVACVRAELLLEIALDRVAREGVEALDELLTRTVDLARMVGRRDGAAEQRRIMQKWRRERA